MVRILPVYDSTSEYNYIYIYVQLKMVFKL
jgi:hypothetical protein